MEKICEKTLKSANIKRIITKFSFLLAFIFVFFSVCATAQAASLYFVPFSGTYIIGQNFTLNVYASTSDKALNAVSGTVTFPQDKLEAVSISKNNSIVNLWVQEPTFSNSVGSFNFEGIVLNPGFIGNQGKIISVIFKVKGGGAASLVFSAGSVLANDGLGTNILENLGSASFVFRAETGPVAPEATTPSETAGAPLAAKISSPTHPDPEKWYANSNPKFVWQVPSDITAGRLLYDRNFSSHPRVIYTPAVSGKQLENIGEGVWYFHLQLSNVNGWGEISHFRFQIDTEKPDYFQLKEIGRSDLTEPQAKFFFDAADKTSGIDHYEIQIDDQPIQNWKEQGVYQTPVLNPAKHIIIVKAVDGAGNFLADSAEFEIKPLEAPKIIDYPQKITEGDPFLVKGTVLYPSATVRMFLQPAENGKVGFYEIQSDGKGNFTIIWEKKLSKGVYKFWLDAVDQRGAKSEQTAEYTIIVVQPEFLRFGKIVIDYLNIIMGLALLLIGIFAVIIYLWRRFILWRKKVKKETQDIEENLRRSFEFLRDKTEDVVAELDGKPGLSGTEKKICDELKAALKSAEKTIGKEVKDLKKLTEK